MKTLLIAITLLTLTACSSSTKKAEGSPSAPAEPVTKDEVVSRYSILELNSAANLLKVVIDESGAKQDEDKGSEIIGCPLTAKQAMKMTMPVKALIDQQMKSEIDAYQNDPKAYGSEKGFESCAGVCGCGVLSDVVESASPSSLPPTAARNHARNKLRLSLKAKHQTTRDSLACAHKQSWFCTSDLRTYLEKEAAKPNE